MSWTLLYDIARAVFLVEYTLYQQKWKKKKALKLRKALADSYLMEMGVTREMIQDYLQIIIASRMGEFPDEI